MPTQAPLSEGMGTEAYRQYKGADTILSGLSSRPEIAYNLMPRLTDYIPHDPTPKQMLFLMLPNKEAFYGGAAGGGKSDALLMAALQYVDIPGYSAVIFRKTLTDLSLSGALIERSHEWLNDTPARWEGGQHRWRFPSGAVLQFGYLDSEMHKFRYQSAEFQYIAFDELTQHWEDDYLYLFSRLRTSRCPKHTKVLNPRCPACQEFGLKSRIPLRIRSASNPGGIGHLWVKNRFKIKLVGELYRGTDPTKPHVPAFVQDNPYLDQVQYLESLSNLDPVTREQLMRGDWGVTADGRFRKAWCRYFTMSGDYIVMLYPGENKTDNRTKSVHKNRCRVFQTIDPASSEREGPGDETRYRRAPSHTVISTWLITPDGDLLWWDCRRLRKEIPDVIKAIKVCFQEHINQRLQPEFIGIEVGSMQVGIYQTLIRDGFPMRPLSPRSGDKIVRATDACNRMEQGKIYLNQDAPWLPDCESELFTWTGHPAEPADQIDTLAYAAMIVSKEAGGNRIKSATAMPGVWGGSNR